MSTLTVELSDEVARLVEETARKRQITPARVVRQCVESAFMQATDQMVSGRQALRSQFEALTGMKDGWLEGRGIAPEEAEVRRLADQLVLTFPIDLPLPFVCATPAGGVFLEWTLGDWIVSAEFGMAARTCEVQAVNTKSKESKDQDLPLNAVADFAAVYDFLRCFI